MNTFPEFSQPISETQLCTVDSSSISNNVNSDNSNLSSPAVPLKRTRAKRSCDFCRKRKSRCDADSTLPCTNCKAVSNKGIAILFDFKLTLHDSGDIVVSFKP